jgi:putative FmdB family regulatory protein
MPVYEYVCKQCNQEFEKVLTLTEHEKTVTCPYCGSREVAQAPAAFYAVTSSKS